MVPPPHLCEGAPELGYEITRRFSAWGYTNRLLDLTAMFAASG